MTNLKKITQLFVLVALAVSALQVPSLLAASAPAFNLTTSPLPVELNAVPGQTISTNIQVENSGTQAAKLDVGLMKFLADSTTGKPTLMNRAAGDSYFDWVSFSQNSFVAEPGVHHTIVMTIKVPPSGAYGYYYAVVFRQASPTAGGSLPNAKIQVGSAVLVLLDVNAPGEKRILQVANFSSAKKIYEYLPASFSVTVKNVGNTHVAPSGNIFISKGGQDNLAVLNINSAAGNVLPGTTRIFDTSWSDGFPVFTQKTAGGQLVTDKKGNPVMTLNWNLSNLGKFRFGHYHAHMLLTYNDGHGDVPIQGDLSFWVIPWKLGSIALILLALVGFGLWSILKPLRKLARQKYTVAKNRKSSK